MPIIKPRFIKRILIILFLASNISFSQISITDVAKKEKPAIKPKPYDGLTNISQKTLKLNNDYYFGLNGFFVPYEAFSRSYKFYSAKPILNRWVNSEIEYNGYNFNLNRDEIKEKIANKKFKILESIQENDLKKMLIKKSDSIKKTSSKIKLASREIYDELGYYNNIYLKIISEETNEEFYFAPWGKNFILNDYFENLKNKYLNKSIRITSDESWLSDSRNKVKNLTTDEMINVKSKSKWTVENITFLKNLYDKCTLENDQYKLSFLLNNDEVGKIGFEIDVHSAYPTKKNINLSCQVFSFMLENDYQEKVNQDKIIIAKKEKEKVAEIAKLEKERADYKRNLIAKYGTTNGELISQNKVSIGMSEQMCVESWGYPLSKKTIVTDNSKMTMWTFYQNKRLYFNNSELILIEY